MNATAKQIAYFSMEIALDPAMPTYSGGLGILAGDTLRAAADRELPMVPVRLLPVPASRCIMMHPGYALVREDDHFNRGFAFAKGEEDFA